MISDFRELNKVIERAQFPIPRKQEIMLKQQRYKYFTKIDLFMMFYYFELNKASEELCTISILLGKFKYITVYLRESRFVLVLPSP